MNTATFRLQKDDSERFSERVFRLAVVFGLHVALVIVTAQAPSNPPSPSAPIRLDMRTIKIPPPLVLDVPTPRTEPPKPLPKTVKPVIRHTETKPQTVKPGRSRPEPVVSSSVLAAAPHVDSAPTTFEGSTQPPALPQAVSHPAPSGPATPAAAPPSIPPVFVPVTAARFDADYLRNPPPVYPALSRKLHEEGKVLLQVQVTETGIAEQVQIKRGSGYIRLDEAALNTVRQWHFIPARRGDAAVAARVVVPIIFRLER